MSPLHSVAVTLFVVSVLRQSANKLSLTSMAALALAPTLPPPPPDPPPCSLSSDLLAATSSPELHNPPFPTLCYARYGLLPSSPIAPPWSILQSFLLPLVILVVAPFRYVYVSPGDIPFAFVRVITANCRISSIFTSTIVFISPSILDLSAPPFPSQFFIPSPFPPLFVCLPLTPARLYPIFGISFPVGVSFAVGFRDLEVHLMLTTTSSRAFYPFPVISILPLYLVPQVFSRHNSSYQAQLLLPPPRQNQSPLLSTHPSPANHNCYVDASWLAQTAVCGMGWTLSDPSKAHLTQRQATQRFVTLALLAEALSLKTAIEAVLNQGIVTLNVFSDSLSLVNLLTQRQVVNELKNVLLDIQHLSLRFSNISFHFISRTKNTLADSLAKEALGHVTSL